MTTPIIALFDAAVAAASAAFTSAGLSVLVSVNVPPDYAGDVAVPQEPLPVEGPFSHKGRQVPEMTMTWAFYSATPLRGARMAEVLNPVLGNRAAPLTLAGSARVLDARLDLSASRGVPDEPGVAPQFGYVTRYRYQIAP